MLRPYPVGGNTPKARVASSQSAVGSEGQEVGRSDGKRGLVRGWIPVQQQERRLLRLPEQGPERTLLRGLELALLRAQARKPLRQQGR
jgi:hypothetical protein